MGCKTIFEKSLELKIYYSNEHFRNQLLDNEKKRYNSISCNSYNSICRYFNAKVYILQNKPIETVNVLLSSEYIIN